MAPISNNKSVPVKKKKSYRHSTTFYRKLKILKAKGEKAIKQHFSVVAKPPASVLPIKRTQDTMLLPIEQTEVPHFEDYLNIENIEGISSDESWAPDDDTSFCDDEEHLLVSQISLVDQLRTWYHSNRITHSALDDLLRILKSNGMNLPTDSRTLLKTPRIIHVEKMGNGEFWYNGLKNNLKSTFCGIDRSLTLSLIFNVDGLPPFKGSPTEFWPILFRIENMPHLKPMVIAIYCGETKPPLKEYLTQFVDELNDVLENGIRINGYNIEVVIRYFVCDTPARSFIKGTVGFNAAHGCIKCTVIGEFDTKGRHMSFPRIQSPLRTDESFRNKFDLDHHKEDTPLLKLPVDMIEDFIVADSLHLFHLGIMRKCLYGWINGNYNFRTKWSAAQIDLLSQMLEECNKRKPAELHRAIRSVKCIKFWKGTEYRTFLLYIGCVVLKDLLCAEAYHNFLTLFCAVTILSSKNYLLKYIDIADCLLKDYIEQFIDIYGIDSISSNVHNIAHVIKDVKKFGNLSEISTYPFENFLGHLKSLIRTGNRPLAQIAKRVIELSSFNFFTNSDPEMVSPYVKNENRTEKHQLPQCDRIFHNVYICKNFMLCSDIKNKWFMDKNNDIICMINATYFEGKIYIYGSALKVKLDFFELPVKSSYLNIYRSDGKTVLPKLYPLNEIKCKLISLKYKEELVFVPLIHTMDTDL